MWKTPFFRISFGLLLVATIIFMLEQINFVFQPLILFVQTITIPFLIAGILYYMFYPVFVFLTNKGLGKTTAIGIIYGAFLSILISVAVFLGPILSKQMKRFIESVPAFTKEVESTFSSFYNSYLLKNSHMSKKLNMDDVISNAFAKLDDVILYVGNNILEIISTVTGAAMIAIIVPFVLFYLLKDGNSFSQLIANWFPIKHQEEVKKILGQMNFALSSYIQGQLLVSLIIGFLIYIGYLIIGLDYALLLALVAMVSNIIPFLGPIIGLMFALVVGMMHSVKMTILVSVVVLSVQAIDSNYISPKILGQKLNIHPLTIIFILLFAGNLAGVIGMLVGVPTYAVSKVIVRNVYRLWKLKSSEKQKKKHPFI